MDETWNAIQEVKKRSSSMKERLAKRKKEREGYLNACEDKQPDTPANTAPTGVKAASPPPGVAAPYDPHIESVLLQCLVDAALALPVDSHTLCTAVSSHLHTTVQHTTIVNLLQKCQAQNLIRIEETVSDGVISINIIHTDDTKILAVTGGATIEHAVDNDNTDTEDKPSATSTSADINSLLSMPSTREKEIKKVGEEIMELLSKPSVREKSIALSFRSQGGAQVQEFCPQGTKDECNKVVEGSGCDKLHFRKIIQTHTDESLGDCSFLNTCFHMDTCKFVHYEVDYSHTTPQAEVVAEDISKGYRSKFADRSILFKPQWIQCDLRYFDMSVLGKFSVVMADPPWDIHMELPYGTMADDEMLNLGVPCLQDDGCIFLWVTGRAMELGRECLSYWGYDRVDEIIWVKTNQLQRIIRTGRTGHWINHGKEHCLVGMKGSPKLNRGLDCDVIVAEVRATSHKPDEIYGIIERLSPGTRKIELFGRQHNVQPNWITLGNQVDGIHLLESELITRFNKRYPDGNCMINQKSTIK